MLRSTLNAAIVVVMLQASSPVAASSTTTNARINLHTATSDFGIFLDQMVTDVGRSEHKHVSGNIPTTGTRLIRGSRKSSWLEGNRFSFEELDDHEIELIHLIRKDMVAAVNHLSVNEMHTDARLAFWLNLHNLTVISHISDDYPVGNIKDLLFKSEDGAVPIYFQNFAFIDGRNWSLASIEKHIFANWQNPLVMYGLFYGTIGSPNIRTQPYTGHTVWDDLQDNASEFVNSIRGTQIWGKRLAISSHYARAANLFPNFDHDVKAHILSQIESPQWHRRISQAKKVDPSVDNWRVADFFDGTSLRGSTSFAQSFSRGGVPMIDFQKMPAHTRSLALEIVRRYKRRNPVVRIEELNTSPEDKPSPDQ